MHYLEAINIVSKELNIPIKVVKTAYNSQWKFIKDHIKELPLKDNISEEDFNKLKTNFNIPSIGKLYCTYNRIIGNTKKYEYINSLIKNVENKEN